jgi:hypothetical protein
MQTIIHIVLVVIAVITIGCSDNGSMLNVPQGDAHDGSYGRAAVSVNVEKIGILAKRASLNVETLILTLNAEGEDEIEREYSLATNEGSIVTDQFANLASYKNWTIEAVTFDQSGVQIHSGVSSFYVTADSVSVVELSVNAQYSILEVSLGQLPDSLTHIDLSVDGVVRDNVGEAPYLTGAQFLSYDYLEVAETHLIEVVCTGVLWGVSMPLYSGSVEVHPEAGIDQTYPLVLTWVGDVAPPSGLAEFVITIGAVGTSQIEAVFESVEIEYESEDESGDSKKHTKKEKKKK